MKPVGIAFLFLVLPQFLGIASAADLAINCDDLVVEQAHLALIEAKGIVLYNVGGTQIKTLALPKDDSGCEIVSSSSAGVNKDGSLSFLLNPSELPADYPVKTNRIVIQSDGIHLVTLGGSDTFNALPVHGQSYLVLSNY